MERLKIKIPNLLNKYSNANPEILEFISNMQEFCKTTQELNCIISLFTQKYCYYFALMLKDAFGGELMVDTKFYHVVCVINNTAYDINGIYEKNNINNLLPIKELREAAELYKHRNHDMDIDHDINNFCSKYFMTLDELYMKIYNHIPKDKRLHEYPNYDDVSIWWNSYKENVKKEILKENK